MKSFSRGSANTRNCYADYAVSLGLFYAEPRIREFLSTLSGLANRFSLGEIIQRNIFASVFNSRPTNQKLPFFDITPMSMSPFIGYAKASTAYFQYHLSGTAILFTWYDQRLLVFLACSSTPHTLDAGGNNFNQKLVPS